MIFFLIVISILILAHTYIGLRIIAPTKIRTVWKAVLWSILMLLMPLAPVYVVLRRYGPGSPWSDVLAWIAYLSLGFFGFLVVFLIIRDMIFLTVWLYGAVKKLAVPASESDRPIAPERRSFLIHSTNLGILGMSGAVSLRGFFNTRHGPHVKNVAVPIHGLPDDLHGFRIVQISDIHISPTIEKDYVERLVSQVKNLKPDIVVFTGDLADGPVSMFKEEVAPFKDLCAVYRSYFVTGNHEYYAGIEDWIQEAERLGFHVLLNEHRVIKQGSGRILLAGVTDFNAGSFIRAHKSDPAKAMAGAGESDVKILLAHQPLNIFAASRAGYDLQISGHTHGGQFFPWQFLVRLQQPFLAGLYEYEKTHIYVSRGTGYWGPPFRLGAPSEITVIRLTKQEAVRGTGETICQVRQ